MMDLIHLLYRVAKKQLDVEVTEAIADQELTPSEAAHYREFLEVVALRGFAIGVTACMESVGRTVAVAPPVPVSQVRANIQSVN
jgi:hypothetical protein